MDGGTQGMQNEANGRGCANVESGGNSGAEVRTETLEHERSLAVLRAGGDDWPAVLVGRESDALVLSLESEQQPRLSAGKTGRGGRGRRSRNSGDGDAGEPNNLSGNDAEKVRRGRGRGRGRGRKSPNEVTGETSNPLGDGTGIGRKGRGRGRGCKTADHTSGETKDSLENGRGRGRRGGRGGRARARGRLGGTLRPECDIEQQVVDMQFEGENVVVVQHNSTLRDQSNFPMDRVRATKGNSTNTGLSKMRGRMRGSIELYGTGGLQNFRLSGAEKIPSVNSCAAEQRNPDISGYAVDNCRILDDDQVQTTVSQSTGPGSNTDDAGQRIIGEPQGSKGPALLMLGNGNGHREGTFTPEMEEIIRLWLAEIEIFSNWPLYAQLDPISRELRLKLNGGSSSAEECQAFKLPLFKSTAIAAGRNEGSPSTCKEILMHVGGPIWTLDWCPQRPGWVNSGADKQEFLAVGAHPSSSAYNRLGACLKGKGLVQIWALDLKDYDSEEEKENQGTHKNLKQKNSAVVGRGTRGRGRGTGGVGVAGSGRGRGKGKLIDASVPEDAGIAEHSVLKWHDDWHEHEPSARMVLALAHEGLVTWDAKWKPVGDSGSTPEDRETLRLGFLAVVLGDGSLQVFDVPLPSIFSGMTQGSLEENLIVNIQPVFRCSSLHKRGQKSIPVSLEWSTWDPHDRLLVGYHDASVAVWKFVPKFPATDTRPLMFFRADSLPLRSVAWAPDGSGPQGRHLIVTAGHSGWVKFWDLRDIFRPIWDLQTSRCCISSMDWLSFPRCVLMSMDDGTLRLLGIQNASSTTPATGQPWRGTHAQGLQCYLCSSFAVWSVQVSRATGLVAYAGATGSVLQFQLTEKAIVKEGARSRQPHYLCGAFAAESENGPIMLISANTNDPVQMKKSSTEWGNTPTSKRNFLASCTLDPDNVATSDSRQLAVTCEDSAIPKPKRAKGIAVTGTICQVNRHRDAQKNSLIRNGDSKELVVANNSLSEGIEEPILPQSGASTACSGPPVYDRFPSRNIAVHRVRWNCNHRRRQWLAYGGATGILRCQEVYPKKKKK
ncbi:hypothetical protein R1flu_009897 [Riccia fluitans]|uniref:Uncharacterized protein n=1 Tax=Riccia fluitans TaxID=41844 RepID=A0ABD1Z3M0_9MARC